MYRIIIILCFLACSLNLLASQIVTETSNIEIAEKLDKLNDRKLDESVSEIIDRLDHDMILNTYGRSNVRIYHALFDSLNNKKPEIAALVWISILEKDKYWEYLRQGGEATISHQMAMVKAQNSVGKIIGDLTMQQNAFDSPALQIWSDGQPVKKGVGILFLDREYRLETIQRLQKIIEEPVAVQVNVASSLESEGAEEATPTELAIEEPVEVATVEPSTKTAEKSSQWWLWTETSDRHKNC